MSHRQAGFTYLLAIFALGVAALAAVKAVPVIQTYEQREKELELLFVGDQFRKAIASYYESTPGTVKRYPEKLGDLLEDKRFLNTRRHLRRIYLDPMTASNDWGIVKAPDGGIQGVFSHAGITPIKASGFQPVDISFEGAQSYRQWVFSYHSGQGLLLKRPWH